MLSRDLRSQASPLCPEKESQIAKIRSPLTPQGEDVKLTAGRGGPQHCQASPAIPQAYHLSKKRVVTLAQWRWWGDWVKHRAMAAI